MNRSITKTKKVLHVAAAQIISLGGSAKTLPRIEALSHAAALLGAEIILFPEVAIHGYDYDMTKEDVRQQAETLDGPIARQILGMARKYHITILAGFFEHDGDDVFNSHLIAEASGALSTQRKHMLTESEKRAGITPGPKTRRIFEINDIRCALLICADTGIEGLREELHALEVNLRFIPTGGGGKVSDMLTCNDLKYVAGRQRYEHNRSRVYISTALDESALEWGSAAVTANTLGQIGQETCHQGHCTITDNHGVIRAQAAGTIVLEHMHEQLINAVLTWNDC
ncbi:MAG: carbon-nitrogen hydrolase family protein [Pirellulales bacterium]|nr:carbon-nitrogen hydrolase family protein [Pirellulales bacterium]